MGTKQGEDVMIDNYNSKLIEWINTQIGKPYIWGETDCGTLVRKGLTIILNRDPFPDILSWDNELICREIWDKLNGVDNAFISFGAKKILGTFAQTGDVAVLEIGKYLTATLIISPDKMLFASTDKGVEIRNITPSLIRLNIRFYRFK